jgi:hypothetical protein
VQYGIQVLQGGVGFFEGHDPLRLASARFLAHRGCWYSKDTLGVPEPQPLNPAQSGASCSTGYYEAALVDVLSKKHHNSKP